jgi:hypothetical protein
MVRRARFELANFYKISLDILFDSLSIWDLNPSPLTGLGNLRVRAEWESNLI